jgi:hypothetical protein
VVIMRRRRGGGVDEAEPAEALDPDVESRLRSAMKEMDEAEEPAF